MTTPASTPNPSPLTVDLTARPRSALDWATLKEAVEKRKLWVLVRRLGELLLGLTGLLASVYYGGTHLLTGQPHSKWSGLALLGVIFLFAYLSFIGLPWRKHPLDQGKAEDFEPAPESGVVHLLALAKRDPLTANYLKGLLEQDRSVIHLEWVALAARSAALDSAAHQKVLDDEVAQARAALRDLTGVPHSPQPIYR